MNVMRLYRTLKHVPMAMVVARVGYRVRCWLYGSPLYGVRDVWGDEPLALGPLKMAPVLMDGGDAARGEALAAGRFAFVGVELPLGAPLKDWLPAKASALWVFHLHYHEWLADLKAAKDVATARALVGSWLERFASWHGVAWHPYPLSLRVVEWLAHRAWLLEGADDDFKMMFDAVLVAQVKHLRRNVEHWLGGNHVIKNDKALLMAGLCLPGHDVLVLEGLSGLLRELDKQVGEDGGHVEASPSYQAQVLQDVVEIVQTLRKAGGVPPHLLDVMERMGTALALMRHGDGTLALFNDGDGGDVPLVDAVLKRAGVGKVVSGVVADVGCVRLMRGKTIVMMDVGKVGPDANPGHAHADTLSVEVTWQGERLLGNCGTFAYQHRKRNVWRGTATKATVQVESENSAEVWGGFRVGRRPIDVGFEAKNVDEGDGLVMGWHDGYRHLGLTHTRKVLLAGDGKALRGEDVVVRMPRPWWRVWPLPVAKKVFVRFPLGVGVSCVLESDSTALLTTPAGHKVRLQIKGGRLDVKPGMVSPRLGMEVPVPVIVVHARMGRDDCKVEWMLKAV
ncbi:MAG: heparinase II/III family protein [Alphaproteobacteria bacterium]